jgi:hypothetical protein
MRERGGGGEGGVEVRDPVGIRLVGLEAPGEVDDRVRVAECRREVIVPSEASHLVGQLTEPLLQPRTDLSACPRDGHRPCSPALDRLVALGHGVHGSQHVSSRRRRRIEASEDWTRCAHRPALEARTERAPLISIATRWHKDKSAPRHALLVLTAFTNVT